MQKPKAKRTVNTNVTFLFYGYRRVSNHRVGDLLLPNAHFIHLFFDASNGIFRMR